MALSNADKAKTLDLKHLKDIFLLSMALTMQST